MMLRQRVVGDFLGQTRRAREGAVSVINVHRNPNVELRLKPGGFLV